MDHVHVCFQFHYVGDCFDFFGRLRRSIHCIELLRKKIAGAVKCCEADEANLVRHGLTMLVTKIYLKLNIMKLLYIQRLLVLCMMNSHSTLVLGPLGCCLSLKALHVWRRR